MSTRSTERGLMQLAAMLILFTILLLVGLWFLFHPPEFIAEFLAT